MKKEYAVDEIPASALGEPALPSKEDGGSRPAAGAASFGARHIAAGIRSLTVQNLVNSLLGFVFLTTLLRYLSPSDYGLYSSALLVTGIGSSVAFFGLQSAATRFVAFLSLSEREARAVSRSIVVLSLVFTSAATIVFVLLAPTLSLYFTRSTASAWVFAASGVWLFSNTISGILQGLVQGMKEYGSLARVLLWSNLVTVALTVVGLLAFHSVIVPIVAWGFYGALTSVWFLTITRKDQLLSNPSRIGGRTLRKVLRYSLPLGIAGVLTVVTGAGDPLVVGRLLDVTQLGEYYAAIAISGGLGVLLFTPLNTAFFPETSSHANDAAKLSKGLRLAFRYTLLAMIPVSFTLAALSRQTIRLFSGGASTYLAGTLSLQMMSAFFLFVAMQGILTSLLLSTGKTVQVMIIGFVTVALDLGLSLTLVPSFGLLGAATSRILVDIAGFLMALYLTRNYLAGVADFGFKAKLFFSSFAVFAALSSLSTFVSDRTLTLIPYALLGAGILLVSARCLRLLTDEDKRYIEHFVPKSMSRLMRLLL